METRCFGGEIVPGRIGGADNHGQLEERRVSQAIVFDERVERAELAVMREGLGSRDVIRDSTRFFATEKTRSAGT